MLNEFTTQSATYPHQFNLPRHCERSESSTNPPPKGRNAQKTAFPAFSFDSSPFQQIIHNRPTRSNQFPQPTDNRQINSHHSQYQQVKFLIDKISNPDFLPTVFAFFPEDKFNNEPGNFTCYAHVGQHGACNIDYANECKEATEEQYKDLKSELEQRGYKLDIVNRQLLIDSGKIWQVYNDGKPDNVLFEGNKTKCLQFIKENNFGYYYKKGKVRIAKVIYENQS